jgi:glycosyltransferase involved in cell wall biosynthesis
MANSEAEHRMLTAAGLVSVWVNHNAFVSPAIFRNLQESNKHFDAVYDARVDPFKRHKLAAAIESLALITAPSQHDESYTRSIRRILTQAYWFNDPLASDYRVMSLSEINAAINQCRVGLCLSATEGAMYASMQYLLAGLPIVSTESRGGRDEFFDSDYVRIVADRADAVAAGVREMRDCPVSATEIRRRTLEKVEQHKTRLFELLDNICATEGCRVDLRCRWDSWTSCTLSYPATPAAIRKRIESAAICTTDFPV